YPEDTLVIRTLFAMAEIYKNNLNDLDNSIAIYKKITDQYSDSEKAPNAMFMIGYIYANDLKDYDKAKESYNKFLTTYPNHMLVPSARWELQNLGRSLDEIPQLQVITKSEK
ncbi:MAG: tetratricopeptide repeat protein, partial [Candidatus Marinimicrobia bacterium]|nr:tetratricopeptide repeat protein [Candidatus Neomarinimicrobiota bacterium]